MNRNGRSLENDSGHFLFGGININTQKEPKPLVGRATYISGEVEKFTDAEAFIRRIKEELPYA